MRAAPFIQALGCLVLAGLTSAVPAPSPVETHRAELVKRAPTCNTPSNRACWTTGFNINTDYEANFPATGVTRNVSYE